MEEELYLHWDDPGIGWVILYRDPQSGRLFNTWINEHDLGHLSGGDPLLVMDVFEHAYITHIGWIAESTLALSLTTSIGRSHQSAITMRYVLKQCNNHYVQISSFDPASRKCQRDPPGAAQTNDVDGAARGSAAQCDHHC